MLPVRLFLRFHICFPDEKTTIVSTHVCSNPPAAPFFRCLCSVNLSKIIRGAFVPETQKTGFGLAVIAIPKPFFPEIAVFRGFFAPKARKLPDLSGRQIRQLVWLKPTKLFICRAVIDIYSQFPVIRMESWLFSAGGCPCSCSVFTVGNRQFP